jgi:hypothetical protein
MHFGPNIDPFVVKDWLRLAEIETSSTQAILVPDEVLDLISD